MMAESSVLSALVYAVPGIGRSGLHFWNGVGDSLEIKPSEILAAQKTKEGFIRLLKQIQSLEEGGNLRLPFEECP